MAQFDLYENPNPASRDRAPYLLDIQADLLSALSTRVVIPFVPAEKPAQHLNPVFEINGRSWMLSTQEMAGVSLAALGAKTGSLKERRSEIVGAVDFLVTGF